MNILYNTEDYFVNNFKEYFSKLDYHLSLPKINTLAHFLPAIVNAENITTLDISKVFQNNSDLINIESIKKKLWRFLNNKSFHGIDLFNSFIKDIINNIGNLKHDKLFVCFNHMFVRNNFVILMFSLKVNNQSIPIFFKCDKTKSNRHREIDEINKKNLFSEKVIFDSIDKVIDLLAPLNSQIIFLADRWFCNLKLMKHIHDKGCFFAIRAKVNSSIKFLIYDKKEGHDVYKSFSDLPIQIHHSLYYKDIPFGSFKFACNLAISRSITCPDDPYFILTNLEPNIAIREYNHRFGSIEMLFKSQKTNGFNLEKTHTRNIIAFENLYSLVCIANVWLTILGVDYIKNYRHYKKKVNIRYIRKSNNKFEKILSDFNLGLTLFKRLYNSTINFLIKCNMKLYL